MANYNKQTGLYDPGVIYELRYCQDDCWTAFYVGESYKPEERLRSHQGSGRNATDESTVVYNTIKQFNEANIKWDMFVVEHYGVEGPTDREDEHIMKLLLQGVTLANEKKGNANWLKNIQADAKEMQKRNMTSYRKYKEVITQEQRQHRLVQRQEKWIKEHHIDRIYVLEKTVYHKHYQTKKEMRDWQIGKLISMRRRLIVKLRDKRKKFHKNRTTAEVLAELRKIQEQRWLETGQLLGADK